MRRDGILRRALFAGTALTFITAAGTMPGRAEDTAALAALLASKGVITQSEAQSIRSAAPAARESRLGALLRKKGVIGDEDMKSIGAALQPAPAASSAAATAMAADAPIAPMYRKAPITVGGIEITPVGYVALTSVTRSTNTGNPGGTNFFAIPFDNTIAGNLGETRLTAFASRLGLRAHAAVNSWLDIVGYFETDFLGNDAANAFVATNSHTMRLRLAYADVNAGPLELTAGQAWSWLTPNRKGLGPDPRTVFTTLNIDPNVQVGFVGTRAAQTRVAWHPNKEFAIGIGMENPEQFGGQGEITFPTAFNAQLAGQIDQANISSTPNPAPDVVAKATYDTDWNMQHIHLEAAGMWREFKVTDIPTTSGSFFVNHTANGWIGTASAIVEVFNGFNAIGSVFWSDGGGRYTFTGLGPDLVVLPNAAGTDVTISTVQSHAFLFGGEWQVAASTQLAGYYGEVFFNNNFGPDTTSGGVGPCNGKPCVGFGGLNSANNNNKDLKEWTVDLKHTWWSDPRLGALQSLLQYSYVERQPWFVASGAPPEAHVHMLFTEFRYVLPGT
jgi:hypothetical protein